MKKYLPLLLFSALCATAQNVVVNLQNDTSEILMPLANRVTLGLVACAVILGVSAIICARILRK